MTSVAGQIKQPGTGGPGAPDVAYQRDVYVLEGGDVETYVPRFTFHGFRYVEVSAEPSRPEILSLEGLLLHTDVAPAGRFACSSELYNRVQRAVEWTLLSNLFSVQSDCPHREKFGYGGDIAATSEMAMFNFDMAQFYAKTVRDLADAARPNGGITETAPFVGIDADLDGLGGGAGPVGWGTAFPLLQWQLYQYYGDRRLLEEQYPATRRWIDFLESRAQDHILDNGISDHESLVPKPRALTGTAFFYQNATLAARIAGILGHGDDAARYTALAGRIREAFNAKFLRAESGQYDSATQAAQAFALFMGLVPDEHRPAALRVLTEDVADHNGHLTTGIFGTKYVLRVLSDMGRADVAAQIVGQEDFPGWGHMLRGGATTLWETWAFSDNVYSHNHPMFGSVSEWFYRTAAGINPADDAVGFDRIVIRPAVVGGLTWASANYESVRGTVHSGWQIEDGLFRLGVTIPVGATAVVHVPAAEKADIREGSVPAERADQVRLRRRDPGEAVYEVPAGEYVFTTAWIRD